MKNKQPGYPQLIFIALTTTFFFYNTTHGQVLSIYEFTGGTECATINMSATSQPANASFSALTMSSSPSCEDNSLEYLSNSWAQGAEDLENYYLTFTIDAITDYEIDATEISFDLRRGELGPTKGKVYYSNDAGSWTLAAPEFTITTTMQSFAIPLSLNTLSDGTIAFRLTAYNAPNSGNPAKMWIDNIAVSGAVLLPIEMVSVYAGITTDHEVLIEWVTASEANNDYFTVERSKDGFVFEEVKRVQGAGYSNTKQLYSALDKNPYSGDSYYRIKQTDNNNEYSYSKLMLVNNAPTLQPEIAIVPNPAHDGIATITATNMLPGSVLTLRVITLQGKEIINTQGISNSNGTVLIPVNADRSFSKGYYLVSASVDSVTVNMKLIIQ